MRSPFHALLARLHPDSQQAGQEFERLRRTLIKFFDWRGTTSPEEAADETLDRLAGKLEEGVAVLDVAAFAHGIARLVFHELLRSEVRHTSLDGLEPRVPARAEIPEAEALARHLEHCLEDLPRESRDLLLAYYAGGEGGKKIETRQRLARHWRLTPNALRSRVQRLRDRVEACVRSRCTAGSGGGDEGRDTFSPGTSRMSEDRSAMPDDAVIRRYLLGESPEEEAAALERAYFAAEEPLDAVSATEWELIDDYLAGRLPPEPRARFEGHYLRSPAHRTRLAVARSLRARPVPKRMRLVPFLLPLAAAAILVLAVLGVVWALRLPETLRGPATSVVSVTLPLVQLRGEGDTPTALLTDDTSVLELRLPRGAMEPPYGIALRTVEGQEVWRGTSTGALPTARIPAEDLPAGDYVVELEGGGRSYVRVVRP